MIQWMRCLSGFITLLFISTSSPNAAEPNWIDIEAETLRHFQALVQFNTQDPPGG